MGRVMRRVHQTAQYGLRPIAPYATESPMITYDLAGKTALVTGGASGIGFATAEMLARNGATVAVNFLPDDPRGAEAVAKLKAGGAKAIAAPGNVGDARDCERMVQKAVADLGRLDLLVSNAGTPG